MIWVYLQNDHLKEDINIMKILTVSDFTDKTLTEKIDNRELEKIDLILSCGDLDPEYLSYLRDRLDASLYYVKGNHDIRYTISNPIGCFDLNMRMVTVNSVRIMGFEGSRWYNGGANQYTEKEMKKMVFKMWFTLWRKGGLDIVITHAPPRHIHDAEDLCHMGFECFVNLIKKYTPAYFIHGHIHKAFDKASDRITDYNGTQVINTCGYNIFEI